MTDVLELMRAYQEGGSVVTLDLIARVEVEIERLRARLAVKCAVPEVRQCERLWAADGAQMQLKSVSPELAAEFPWGCDTVQHLGVALLAARAEIERLKDSMEEKWQLYNIVCTKLDAANTRFNELRAELDTLYRAVWELAAQAEVSG